MIEKVVSIIGYVVLAGIGSYLALLVGSLLMAIAFPLIVVSAYFGFLAILVGTVGFFVYKFWLWLLD